MTDPATGEHDEISTPPPDRRADLTFELTKLVLNSNLEFVRTTTQIVQGLSGALLTASVAATVALGGVRRFQDVPIVLAALPTVFFAGALVCLAVTGLSRRQQLFDYTSLESTLSAYEDVLDRRRRDLLIPSVLLSSGVLAALGIVVSAT